MRKICALFVIHYLCSRNVFGIFVTTEKGIVSGIKLVSRSGAPFYAYFAIPYAKPPVGELRFQPPQEPDKWDGIRDGAFPKFRCTQYDKFFHFNGVIGSEDCLYLNVFTPMVYSEANLPVMVCIHGGAFFRGDSAECFPSYFMDKKVLVVTFNYRLGILGFLSAADQVLPGNYGMKDQVAVLHWVRRNIKAFGGNPNCVTIFGESAGGASVHLHMYSSLSRGLFHRAISQSGSATVPWAIVPPVMSKNRTLTLGILTGCPLSSTKNLVYCLRKLPAENLAALLLRYYVWNDKPTVLFPVVIEPDIEGAFLTKKPLYGEELIQVPWIIGITSGEGGYVAAEYLSNDGLNAREFNENFKRYIPIVFCFYYTAELYLLESISQKIKEFYFQDRDIGFRTAFELRDMVTDGAFAHNIIKSALHYKGDRYFYYYDHLNERSFNEVWGGSSTMKFLGVSHGDDLISLFPQMWTFPSILNGRDLIVSVKMINYWTNFAHNGHPNDDQVCQSRWEPVTSSDLEFLHIDGVQDKMSKKLLFDRYSFWETLPLNGAEEGYQTFATLLIDSVQNFSTSLQDMEYHRDEL